MGYMYAWEDDSALGTVIYTVSVLSLSLSLSLTLCVCAGKVYSQSLYLINQFTVSVMTSEPATLGNAPQLAMVVWR